MNQLEFDLKESKLNPKPTDPTRPDLQRNKLASTRPNHSSGWVLPSDFLYFYTLQRFSVFLRGFFFFCSVIIKINARALEKMKNLTLSERYSQIYTFRHIHDIIYLFVYFTVDISTLISMLFIFLKCILNFIYVRTNYHIFQCHSILCFRSTFSWFFFFIFLLK